MLSTHSSPIFTEKSYELDRYDIQIDYSQQLGNGASGTVYVCKVNGIDQPLAVKLVDFSEDELASEKCRREREIMIAVTESNAPSTILLHGYCIIDFDYALCMDLASRGSLEKHLLTLKSEYHLPFMLYLTEGVAHLHKNDIAHRDIKPANVLITEDWMPKLCDFSASYHINNDSPGDEIGTPMFMAPEVLLNMFLPNKVVEEKVQNAKKADVYSLALTLRCIFFRSKEPYHAIHSIDDLIKKVAFASNQPAFMEKHDCPQNIKRAIESGLVKDPVKRATANKIFILLEDTENIPVHTNIQKEYQRNEKASPLKMGLFNNRKVTNTGFKFTNEVKNRPFS